MAETHLAPTISFSGVAPAPIQGAIHTIWNFIQNSGQTTLRFALDGATPAVSLDGTTYGTPTVYTDWANNSFMIVEPIGGSSWQLKVNRTTSTTELYLQMGMDGGWDHVTKTFPVSVCRTAATKWLTSSPSAGDKLYLSTGDADGYTYLRFVHSNPGAVEGNIFKSGVYAGGYLTADTAEDLVPVCCLVGIVTSGASTQGHWGYRNTGNLSRSPVEADHSTLDLTSAGHCCGVGIAELATLNLSRAGRWVNLPVALVTTGGVTLGYFGPNTMLSGNSARSDGGAATPAEYLVMNDLLMRWKP